MHRKIFAMGDSHPRRCFENHPYIADSTVLAGHNKMDGKTAFKLERHEKKLMRILSTLKDKELIFCFGEVDVRLHNKYKGLGKNKLSNPACLLSCLLCRDNSYRASHTPCCLSSNTTQNPAQFLDIYYFPRS
jgi:hypothetical protein